MKVELKTNQFILHPLVLILLFTMISCSTISENSGLEISITIAPAVLNLQNKGQVVTVHTDISYGDVNGSTVYLNGTEVESWKSDDLGFFVAKFLIDAIKDLPLNINEFNTMRLEGMTTDNRSFWGEAQIKVIDTATQIP
jgi:hypothetical protein